MQAKHMQFIKQAIGLCLQKLGQKHASKDGIELAVFVAFGEVLSFGLGVVELVLVRLLAELLVDGLSFIHTVVYDAYEQTHNQEKEIKDLSLSSNRKHIKYGVWSKVFEWIPNGMTETELRDTW